MSKKKTKKKVLVREKVQEKNLKLDELEIKWTMKDFFEFLKPNKRKVLGSIFFGVLIFAFLFFMEVIPGLELISEESFSSEQVRNVYLALGIVFIGIFIITYTIISLIIYLRQIWREGK